MGQAEPQQPRDQLGGEPLTLLFFFDVLGFSERVREIGLTAIYREYERLVKLVDSISITPVLTSEAVGDTGAMIPVSFVMPWEAAYFSDTILLWTPFPSPLVLDPATAVARQFFCECLANGLPLRGAMAAGPAVMDKTRGIFLGEPIVDAARAEAAQRSAGIGVARSWGQHRYYDGSLGRADSHLPYTKHIKPGREEVLCSLALDWPRTWRESPHLASRSLDAIIDGYSRPGFEHYWQATHDFVDFSASNPAWWTAPPP